MTVYEKAANAMRMAMSVMYQDSWDTLPRVNQIEWVEGIRAAKGVFDAEPQKVTEEQLERAAEAAFVQHFEGVSNWRSLSTGGKNLWRMIAKAALKAVGPVEMATKEEATIFPPVMDDGWKILEMAKAIVRSGKEVGITYQALPLLEARMLLAFSTENKP